MQGAIVALRGYHLPPATIPHPQSPTRTTLHAVGQGRGWGRPRRGAVRPAPSPKLDDRVRICTRNGSDRKGRTGGERRGTGLDGRGMEREDREHQNRTACARSISPGTPLRSPRLGHPSARLSSGLLRGLNRGKAGTSVACLMLKKRARESCDFGLATPSDADASSGCAVAG